MKIHASLPFLGASLLVLGLATAHAETAPTRPTEAQMKAVHDCAAAKGVEMPTPPAGGPPKGEKPAEGQQGAGGPPPEGGQGGGKGQGPHGPKLTDAQRAIVDACFAEQGLTPPKRHRPDGKPPMNGKPTTETGSEQ